MIKQAPTLGSILLLMASFNSAAFAQSHELNEPPHPTAQRLVKQAIAAAESGRPRAAATLVKKAISISPDYLRAHLEYWNIEANFLDRYDEVNAEYLFLVRHFPKNPVYLMTSFFRSNANNGRDSLQRVIQLAPQWAWSHYARAMLIKTDDPEQAISELMQCIAENSSAKEAYDLLIELQEKQVHRIDDAIKTAQIFAAQKDIRASQRLLPLWRLRLVKAGQSAESRLALKRELSALAGQTKEVEVLLAIRSAYLELLKDPDAAQETEKLIARLDPTWNPQRGWIYTQIKFNQSGVPRSVVLVNDQIAIQEATRRIVSASGQSAADRIRELEKLFDQKPTVAMRRIICEEIFRLAIRSNDSAAVEYGRVLHKLDRTDAALLAEMAIVLANRREKLGEAYNFAQKARVLTSQFRPVKRPRNTPQTIIDNFFPEKNQREAQLKNRGLALEAVGWVLVQLNQAQQAEPLLRQALAIEASEDRLRHLAQALQTLRRFREAADYETEANHFLAGAVRKKFILEPISDLPMKAIDGRWLNLSDLKTKVVLINFWATWCFPCTQEMPYLEELFRKYKSRGLEVIAVSTDEDSSKVRPFVRTNKLTFWISDDLTLRKKFAVEEIPVSLFIDKNGNLRYRKIGFEEGDQRELEAAIIELLK